MHEALSKAFPSQIIIMIVTNYQMLTKLVSELITFEHIL